MIRKSRPYAFKALDDGKGIFEAIVAVFGNVDRADDKILPGAFKGSLDRWKAKGRPIPVIFSHEWDNLDAHIGEVLEAREEKRGLYVKAQLDLEEDFAARVWKKMKRGTLAEFSFSYDTLKEKRAGDVNELQELELLEVGPCLVGMNPATQLLNVKDGAAGRPSELADQLARELEQEGYRSYSSSSASSLATRIALELEEMGAGLTPWEAKAQIRALSEEVDPRLGDGPASVIAEVELAFVKARLEDVERVAHNSRIADLQADLRAQEHSEEWIAQEIDTLARSAAQRIKNYNHYLTTGEALVLAWRWLREPVR